MIGKSPRSSIRGQERGGCLMKASDQDGSPRSHDFCADIISVGGLYVRLNVANCPSLVPQVDHTCDHIVVLGDLRADCHSRVAMNFNDLISHEPPPHIE